MRAHILNRHSSLAIGRDHVLKNRVVIPPMASGTATTGGFVTSNTISHYQRLARAGAGLVMVEYTFVHSSGRSEEDQLGISTDLHVKELKNLAEIIHKSNAKAGIQITHSGGKSSTDLTGGEMLSASPIVVPVKDRLLETPKEMNIEQIAFLKEAFLAAVSRADKAGFDLVELHAAHGYGLNQWLSPLTNQRKDQYGEGLAGRFLLLREIIISIREHFPKLLLSVRMPGQDFLSGGLTTKDSAQIALWLEELGVDILNISSGIGGWKRPDTRRGEGYLVPEAASIQAVVTIPVIGVGGIETGAYIDSLVSQGQISLAAVGRAILKDPVFWYEKNMAMQIEETMAG